jgi:hypothetical protein
MTIAGPGARCRGCGYRLRGLPVTSVCPECARSIESSLRGDQLIYADPTYLNDLTRGILIIQIALALATLSFLWWIIGLLIPSSDRAWYSLARNAVTVIVMFVGIWLFSKPDPGLRLSDPGDRPRKILRAASLIVCVAEISSDIGTVILPKGVRAVSLLDGAIKGSMDVGSIVTSLLNLIGMISWIVQFFASMLYVKWLARRMPSKKHYKWAGVCMWILPIIYITQVLKPIAFILYFILVDDVRVTLKQIRSAQSRPQTPAAVDAVATTASGNADAGEPNQPNSP